MRGWKEEVEEMKLPCSTWNEGVCEGVTSS